MLKTGFEVALLTKHNSHNEDTPGIWSTEREKHGLVWKPLIPFGASGVLITTPYQATTWMSIPLSKLLITHEL
jgi:hypothetical protein